MTHTRTREGRCDLLGPGADRDCHSQWPGPRSCAEAEDAAVNAASAAASVSRVFMLKSLIESMTRPTRHQNRRTPVGSAKDSRWVCFRTDISPHQRSDRHLSRRRCAMCGWSRARKRRNQRNCNCTAHFSDTIGRHALTWLLGLRILLRQTHHFSAIGAHIAHAFLGNGRLLRDTACWHGVREGGFLAHQAKQCPQEQQQGKPTPHHILIAVAYISVNWTLGLCWLQTC